MSIENFVKRAKAKIPDAECVFKEAWDCVVGGASKEKVEKQFGEFLVKLDESGFSCAG